MHPFSVLPSDLSYLLGSTLVEPRPGSAAPAPAGDTGLSEGHLGAARVLIVEDEFLTSWHLSETVSSFGCRIVGASATGEDAVRLAAETKPDVVLMDVSLKGTMDGVEAARAIYEDRPVAIIFITAYTDEDTSRRINDIVGALRLVKPVVPRELRVALGSALESLDDD